MSHPILGKLEPSETGSEDRVATIQYDSQTIEILILPDDKPLESTLNLAADVVTRLKQLDEVAKQVIVTDLKATYESWDYDDGDDEDDEPPKPVVNPPLSDAEFAEKFRLKAITISGDATTELFYDDSELLGGSTVVVTSRTGIAFRDAQADLFG